MAGGGLHHFCTKNGGFLRFFAALVASDVASFVRELATNEASFAGESAMTMRKILFVGIGVLVVGLIIGGVAVVGDGTAPSLSRQLGADSGPSAKGGARSLWRSGRRWWHKFSRQLHRKPYPLDDRSRVAVRLPYKGLDCPQIDLETYTGTTLGYTRPIRVNPYFEERLERFEKIASDVAEMVYGRPPTRVIHFGAYNCRSIAGRRFVLSEHAFGNGLDVAGFEFDALPAAERRKLGRAGGEFEVSVLFHWDATRGFAKKHAVFLRELTRELERRHVFRGILAPHAAGHDDHLHLDMGWWSYYHADMPLGSPQRSQRSRTGRR